MAMNPLKKKERLRDVDNCWTFLIVPIKVQVNKTVKIREQIQTGCFYLFTLLLATGLKIKENNNNTERKELNCKTCVRALRKYERLKINFFL